MAEVQDHLALGRQVNPLVRHGRAQRVPAEAFEPGAIPRRHHHARVEVW
jgi:hypothetical protein